MQPKINTVIHWVHNDTFKCKPKYCFHIDLTDTPERLVLLHIWHSSIWVCNIWYAQLFQPPKRAYSIGLFSYLGSGGISGKNVWSCLEFTPIMVQILYCGLCCWLWAFLYLMSSSWRKYGLYKMPLSTHIPVDSLC